jgi:hypothetical protein
MISVITALMFNNTLFVEHKNMIEYMTNSVTPRSALYCIFFFLINSLSSFFNNF